MSFPKYEEVKKLTDLIEIDQEIFLLQKSIFDLKMKRASSGEGIKPHLFTHAKRRIAQLKFKKSLIVNLKT